MRCVNLRNTILLLESHKKDRRYHRSNQKPSIGESQTIAMAKNKNKKWKHKKWWTKHYI